MPIACIGIAVTFRHSYRLTKFYTHLLSTLTVIEIIGIIISAAFYPFLERHIRNILQDTIDECDVTSVAYYAIVHVQMIFKCCGLNHPDSMTNDTRIQTSCYSHDKYTVYDSYCNPERFYEINCFTRVYNDCLETLFIILVYAAITIITQGITIYFAVLHGLHIQRERNNAIELATTADDVIMSRI
ncbi:hypothetical protein HA402_000600 [Bradysia odoriphaga]|nr:hypothetical protein HA402_000600 [Bradysia odoriphaga]